MYTDIQEPQEIEVTRAILHPQSHCNPTSENLYYTPECEIFSLLLYIEYRYGNGLQSSNFGRLTDRNENIIEMRKQVEPSPWIQIQGETELQNPKTLYSKTEYTSQIINRASTTSDSEPYIFLFPTNHAGIQCSAYLIACSLSPTKSKTSSSCGFDVSGQAHTQKPK